MQAEDKGKMSSSTTLPYRFWTPPAGRTVEVGPERTPVPLPGIPLPLHREDLAVGEPAADAIGRGVYDYLRQYPDCPHNTRYAELLREAYPHYLADMGAGLAMLDHKEVDALYVRRKITGMKILALLDPENAGLWRQMGIAAFDLAMTFTELLRCRPHLLEAMGYLQRVLKLLPGDQAALNYLGQIDFFLGDYPAAARRWSILAARLAGEPAGPALAAKVTRIERGEVPDHPLVDDLEAEGEAMAACGAGDYSGALRILEALEEEGTLPAECPTPEFYYLLGFCRGKTGDAAGSFAAFEQALELDPGYAPALEGKETVMEGREF